MDEKEILIGKLILFLKRFNVYEEYIAGLARVGSHGETIDEIAEWCIEKGCRTHIIDHSFGWHRVSLRGEQTSWGYLDGKFRELYHSLPYEETELDTQWDNMWDN